MVQKVIGLLRVGRRRRLQLRTPPVRSLRQILKIDKQGERWLKYKIGLIDLNMFAGVKQLADFSDHLGISVPGAVLDSSLQQEIIVIDGHEKQDESYHC